MWGNGETERQQSCQLNWIEDGGLVYNRNLFEKHWAKRSKLIFTVAIRFLFAFAGAVKLLSEEHFSKGNSISLHLLLSFIVLLRKVRLAADIAGLMYLAVMRPCPWQKQWRRCQNLTDRFNWPFSWLRGISRAQSQSQWQGTDGLLPWQTKVLFATTRPSISGRISFDLFVSTVRG